MQRIDHWLPEVEDRGWAEWVKVVRRYKLLVTRPICSGPVMFSMVTTVNNTVYLKVAEKVDLTSSHYKEKNLFLCKVMDVN